MARGTRTLAGQAVSAARRALGMPATGSEQTEHPVTDTAAVATEKAPAKKTAAKKTAAKKTAAKKTAAKKTAAKKTAAKKTAAKKTAATKTAAKKTPALKKAPAKKTAVTKTATTPAKQARTTHPAPDEKAAPVTTSPAKKTTAKKPAAKKTTAKSAPKGAQDAADSLVVKSDEEAWTPAELDELLGELHEQRDHSAAVVAEMETELDGLMRDSGDGAGQDQADVGATSFERDHEMSVLNSERDKLAQIDRALARIADGSYGQCESCGQPIGKLRLLAFPRATLCMPCKQREERR